jgi:hypothetical protein
MKELEKLRLVSNSLDENLKESREFYRKKIKHRKKFLSRILFKMHKPSHKE